MEGFAIWQTILAVACLVLLGGCVLFLCIAPLLPRPQSAMAIPYGWQPHEIQEIVHTAAQYAHLQDPDFQQHLLWRHRVSYFSAFKNQGAGTLALPAYPLSIPIERWRAQCSRVLDDNELRAYLTHFYPHTVPVYQVMWQLCSQAEKLVAQPSAAHDHLSVMQSQLHQLNSITTKARELKDSIRANTTLTPEEQNAQIEWIDQLCKQRIQELLKEDDHGSTSKDEVISPS